MWNKKRPTDDYLLKYGNYFVEKGLSEIYYMASVCRIMHYRLVSVFPIIEEEALFLN